MNKGYSGKHEDAGKGKYLNPKKDSGKPPKKGKLTNHTWDCNCGIRHAYDGVACPGCGALATRRWL